MATLSLHQGQERERHTRLHSRLQPHTPAAAIVAPPSTASPRRLCSLEANAHVAGALCALRPRKVDK